LNPFADFAEALRFAWKRPQILALLLVKTGGGLAGGVILLLTIFAFQVYNAGSFGIGLLQFARGVGILSGPLLVAPFVRGQINRAQRVISFGFLLTGVAYIIFGSTPTIVLGMVAAVFAHIGWSSNWTLSATLLQRLTPDRIRGRIFSMDIGLLTLTLAFSTFVTGVATDQFDPRTVSYVLGGVFVLYGILWTSAVIFSQRRHREQWQDGQMEHIQVMEEGYAVSGE
jgi:hypothetical protein